MREVLALAALNGLGMVIFWPAFQAWIAELQSGSDLVRNIGSFNMSWTASHLIGPTLSGLLFGLYFRLPFWVAAVLCLTLFFVIRASVHDGPSRAGKESGAIPLEAEESYQERKFLYAIWIANFASFFLLGNARYQFPKLARELTMSPSMIGLVMSCIGLAQFLGFLFLRGTERWHFNRFYLLGAQGVAAGGLVLLFSSSQRPLLASALIMLGICASLTYYSSLYYSVHLSRKKGKGAGLHESIVGSGVVLGPFLGGVVAHSVGLRAPYLLCLAVLGAAVIGELILTRERNSSGLGPVA